MDIQSQQANTSAVKHHLIEENSRDFFSGANILALEPTLKVSYAAENSDGRFVFPGDEAVWTISIENKFDQEKNHSA